MMFCSESSGPTWQKSIWPKRKAWPLFARKKELLEKLKGKITHVHLIDSDGTLNEHHTSTHNPFGTGKLNFDKLLPAVNQAGVPNDWWVVDLCFWPNAWDVTAESKTFLDKMRKKYAG